MSGAGGKTFSLLGPLAAFPRRLARREIERQGGTLQHGVTRRTSHVVLGRGLVETSADAKLRALFDLHAGQGRQLLSENGLLRMLGLASTPEGSALGRQSLIEQAGLSPRDFDLLALFDAFEHDAEPFSFRDLILAKKYAGLIAGGATWNTIAKSIHRVGPVASLTAISLHADRNDAIYQRLDKGLSELDGQVLLPLDRDDTELEELFALAEAAEEAGLHAQAAALYARCLAIEPGDATAAFNQGNCLRAAGQAEDAARAYMNAIKRDPNLVEAWFNLAGLHAAAGRKDAARRHLNRAIALDGRYADAVFNLATLEFDSGNLAEARKWWARYLELDDKSKWARTASRGIQLIDLQTAHKTAS